MRQAPIIFCLLLALPGCSTAVPTAVTYRGHSLTGEGAPTADMAEFSFNVADSQVSCRGGYVMRKAFAPKFTFPISCSDGRTGQVQAERGETALDEENSQYPVRGKIIFSDGAVGMFNLGADARYMSTKSLVYQSFVEQQDEPKFK